MGIITDYIDFPLQRKKKLNIAFLELIISSHR